MPEETIKEESPVEAQNDTSEGTQTTEDKKEIKTPPNELYGALSDERSKRKAAEAKKSELESQLEELKTRQETAKFEGQYSDEGAAIVEKFEKKISELEGQLNKSREVTELQSLVSTYPAIANHLDDFEEFRRGYPGVAPMNAAKLFMSEKGLNGTSREGLESPTGGTRQESEKPKEITTEELTRLRETNPDRWMKLAEQGKLPDRKLKIELES